MKPAHSLAYNSTKETVTLPEYGRSVHELIQYARSITEKDKQQKVVEQIIQVILTLQPELRQLEDYRSRLWKHIYHIANYELLAEPPSGEVPTLQPARNMAVPTPYPTHHSKYRHYGKYVQELIAKAKNLEPGPIRDGLVYTIGAYMKLAYKTWNKEHFAGDFVIQQDLLKMSEGLFDLDTLGQDVERQVMAQRGRRQVHPDQPDLLSPSQRRRFYQQQFKPEGSSSQRTQRKRRR
jgi:hypothetical protein